MIFCHDLVIFRLTAMIFCFQKRVLRSIFKTYASCLLMKRLLLLLFVLPNCFVCGQDLRHGLDSLLARIEMLPDTDTATVDLRNDYVKQAMFANPADSSLLNFAEATLAHATKVHYARGRMLAYDRLALISQYVFSNPYKALDYYHQALSVAEEAPDLISYRWGILGGIATIYYEQEEYEKALRSFREILANNDALGLTATANIANVFGSMGDNDSAIFYYRKALSNKQVEQNPTYKANLHSNLSLIYANAGNSDSAVISAEQSLRLIDAHGIEFVRPTAYANAAMAYLKAGNFEKAEYYANESLKLSDESGNHFLQKSAWGTLADVFAAKGDYKKALDAYVKFSALKDSLNNQNRRVEINRRQMEFDFENERALAQAEIQRQTTIKKASLLGGLALLTVSVLGFVMYKRRRDAVAQKKEAEFKALVSETELKALRAQMNPHFIFNSLNSIGDYLLKNDTAVAHEYLTHFAKLMRMTLEHSEHHEIPLSDDLQFIELYLKVEAKRLPGRFSYTVNVGEDVDTENTLVPPLILQPFIENSIWHGFKSVAQKGHIDIEIKKSGEMLICSVDDNGSGRNGNDVGTSKKSLGVAITENRIKIFNARNNANGRLTIIDKVNKSGTRVEVSLPLQTAF